MKWLKETAKLVGGMILAACICVGLMAVAVKWQLEMSAPQPVLLCEFPQASVDSVGSTNRPQYMLFLGPNAICYVGERD